MSSFTVTVTARNAEEALNKVDKRLVPGFTLSGGVQERSARSLLWSVEVVNRGGNVNDCWAALTSYGISPSKALGSIWQEGELLQ